MAEVQGDDGEIFVYMGGNQQVPDGVRRARIHKSVKIVRARAFYNRRQLISVEFHDGVELIEEQAFYNCRSLCGPMKLLGVKIIKQSAFQFCRELTDVEFSDKLETIELSAFNCCKALKKIGMPSVRTIGKLAFSYCTDLTDVEFGEELRTLNEGTFYDCRKLKRIALPLKSIIIGDKAFIGCPNLTTVNLLGIHQTVASLHLESWRNEMNNEINRINQTLPTLTIIGKTEEIQQWMETVIQRLDHYEAEHCILLKEATTLLELALWKANRDENNGGGGEREGVRSLVEVESARNEMRVTSGADVVIENVLPFLALK